MRYFVEISYHGRAYHGWQMQPNAHTVQAEIESCLKQLTGSSLEIIGSGRTDRGVHARRQVFHVDLPDLTDIQNFSHKLNGILPEDIAVRQVWEVPPEAHARYHATRRSYQYRICHFKDPFEWDRSYYLSRIPDWSLMNEACQKLLEQRDFQCFSRVKTAVENFDCEMMSAEWRYDNDLLVFYVSANRFLRGMVRAIVGTLLEVGFKKIDLQQFQNILNSKDRKSAGPSVPARGLFLTGVDYPETLLKK